MRRVGAGDPDTALGLPVTNVCPLAVRVEAHPRDIVLSISLKDGNEQTKIRYGESAASRKLSLFPGLSVDADHRQDCNADHNQVPYPA